MAGPWDGEKWQLEQSAVDFFVAALNEQLGTSYRVLFHGDRPDVVIKDEITGHTIGVEVTHLFYDEEEARALLGRSSTENLEEEDIHSIVERLNKLLIQKSEKAEGYDNPGELALLVRVASPAFEVDDFYRYKDLIKVPHSRYKHIWLLFYNYATRKWDIIKPLQAAIDSPLGC